MTLIRSYAKRFRHFYSKPDLFFIIKKQGQGSKSDYEDFDEDSREGWVENSQELYAATP